VVVVNQVQADGEAAQAALVQAAMSQAFALSVLASSLGGWRVIGPDGATIDTSDAAELLAAGVQRSGALPACMLSLWQRRAADRLRLQSR